MDKASQKMTTDVIHKKNLKQSALIKIERIFNAPVKRVWQAFINPELAKQWWGPEGYTSPECKIDFRVGGTYLFAMKSPDNTVIWSTGAYEQILEFEKIVFTDQFSDENGVIISAKDVGMPGAWPKKLYVTLKFESLDDGQTKLLLIHEGIPVEMHDDCESGWESSLNKLQKIVELT